VLNIWNKIQEIKYKIRDKGKIVVNYSRDKIGYNYLSMTSTRKRRTMIFFYLFGWLVIPRGLRGSNRAESAQNDKIKIINSMYKDRPLQKFFRWCNIRNRTKHVRPVRTASHSSEQWCWEVTGGSHLEDRRPLEVYCSCRLVAWLSLSLTSWPRWSETWYTHSNKL